MATVYPLKRKKMITEQGTTLQPFFMTKVACEDEITMEDIRKVQMYRDGLILEMNIPKVDYQTFQKYNDKKNRLFAEIQGIHKWLRILKY